MTREELLAQAEALEWAVTATPTKPFGQNAIDCISRAQELRAQAESMPTPRVTPDMVAAQADIAGRLERLAERADARQVRLEAMNNGAATNAGRAHVNLGTSGSATEDAAPPSAAQQAAWMYQHEETGNVTFRPHNERWVDHRRYVEIPLYAAPPDLAARVEELESIDGMLEMLPTMLLNGSTQCPLCGQSEIHTHTPSEIIIYRNGVKYGRGIGQTHAIAERVRELEALLTDIDSTMTALYESDLGRKWAWPTTARQTSMLRLKEHINAIRAALAKGE